MPPEQDTPDRITRVIDFRIPLPWLLTGVAGVSWALVSRSTYDGF